MSTRQARHFLFAVVLMALVPTALGQAFGDQIVIRPANPSSSDTISFDVPVKACFHADPAFLVDSSSLQVAGNVIAIAVDEISFLCFSAGDPVVNKAVTLTAGPLAPGSYAVNYTLTSNRNFTVLQRSATFAVSLAQSVPTLNAVCLVLLSGLIGLASMRASHSLTRR